MPSTPLRNRAAWYPVLVAAFLLGGCSGASKPKDPVAEAEQLRDQAKAAREAGDETAAEKAAEAATDLRKTLKAEVETTETPTDAQQAQLQAVTALSQDALVHAEWTVETRRLDKIHGSLKARAYRSARGAGLKSLMKSLAYAARQHGKTPEEERTKIGEGGARLARLVAHFSLKDPMPELEGETTPEEWEAIAATLDGYALQPPVKVNLLLAGALHALGQPNLALVEVEQFKDVESLNAEDRQLFLFMRLICMMHAECPRHGHAEVKDYIATPEATRESGALAYLFLAAMDLEDHRFVEADEKAALAIKTWPNNPLCVYLTGERQAADGDYEAAAQSLEKAAAGTEIEDLAAMLAQRARDLRDGKEDAKGLFLDSKWTAKAALYALWVAARESETNQQLQADLRTRLQAARDLAAEWKKYLPLIGEKQADDGQNPAGETAGENAAPEELAE